MSDWYYFSVSRIYENGELECNPVKSNESINLNGYRKRKSYLYDYPHVLSLWAGIVYATSIDNAYDIVKEKY